MGLLDVAVCLWRRVDALMAAMQAAPGCGVCRQADSMGKRRMLRPTSRSSPPATHHMSWLGTREATSTVRGRELLLSLRRICGGGLLLLGPAPAS